VATEQRETYLTGQPSWAVPEVDPRCLVARDCGAHGGCS